MVWYINLQRRENVRVRIRGEKAVGEVDEKQHLAQPAIVTRLFDSFFSVYDRYIRATGVGRGRSIGTMRKCTLSIDASAEWVWDAIDPRYSSAQFDSSRFFRS